MKRTTFTAAAALLLLAACQGPAFADGGAAPAPTAPATWQPRGSVLGGAATTADAPAMKAGTTYRDTIRPGQTRMYGIALDAKSSAYASAFALPPPGAKVTYDDGIELKLVSADGTECDSREEHFDDDGDARPVGTAVERTIGDEDDSCQGANQYTLQVHRTSDAGSDQAVWPLELRYVLEPPLRSGTVPPPAPPFASASPTPLLTGGTRRAAGGTSFETAAAIRTGIWKDRLLPGETRFYKVPVDWGQQATVFADFSSARQIGSGLDFVGAGVRLTAYSPVRQYVDGADGDYSGSPTSLAEQLPPASYANRSSDDDTVQRVRYAGWYYFAVSVHPDVAKQVGGAVPVTLRVQVKGAAQPAPAYAGNPAAAGIGVTAHDVAAADGTATGGGSSSSALRAVAYGAFGVGTLLLLVLAAWFAAARRRPVRG
ncbi:hypothetical protein SAMN05216223_105172 [Actinacidiphila yanglinensis]|uniref:Uncharacterized protein n=1 Tax=Actinacidiphila yanglinensis TaxID=310779 RepID=A0A1H6A6J5_9ACTN|nr:hypothetical protein [Actinacidiphila yanglinensis]SEG43657.1 hypothetical protein SAMN05216223_105172 [Actinacidiphila yanglinensis]